jgi:sigma-B regulation protein RsbQ
MQSVLKRNNVNVIGKGDKVMVLAHGFGCDQNSWQFITDAFADDYRIVLFDYVGAGKSDLSAYNSDRYNTLDGYARDVVEICKELNVTNAIFVGHSVSSMIGALAAIQDPSLFEKLIFIGPSPRYINDKDYVGGFERKDLEGLFESMESNYLGWSGSLAPAIMGNADRPELGEFLTNSFCATDPEIAKEFARVTFFSDNRADLKKLKAKSLTLQCKEDIIAPLSVGEYVQQNTPGNTMFVMEATGHCPHISAPRETIEAIKSFIN